MSLVIVLLVSKCPLLSCCLCQNGVYTLLLKYLKSMPGSSCLHVLWSCTFNHFKPCYYTVWDQWMQDKLITTTNKNFDIFIFLSIGPSKTKQTRLQLAIYVIFFGIHLMSTQIYLILERKWQYKCHFDSTINCAILLQTGVVLGLGVGLGAVNFATTFTMLSCIVELHFQCFR